jgi:hypothetical protein
MAKVVAPHSVAAASAIASPSHWRSPTDGLAKPSAKAQATPAKAQTSPNTCHRPSRSPLAMSGMPKATTNGDR